MTDMETNLVAYMERHAEAAETHYEPPYVTGKTTGHILQALEALKHRLKTGTWKNEETNPTTEQYVKFCKMKMGEL